jgi:hypothetical protein
MNATSIGRHGLVSASPAKLAPRAGRSFGEGPQVITGHAVADFPWHQLPVKWLCGSTES